MDRLQIPDHQLPSVSILVVSRPTLFRHGFSVILSNHHPDWALKEAESFNEAIERAGREMPDVILIDEQLLEAGSRPDKIRRLRAVILEARLLVLADTDDRSRIMPFIDAGAHGYLPKSADTHQVLCALNAVLCGGVYVPATLTQPAVTGARRPAETATVLTDRQREVFELMAQGFSTKIIARQLGLAVGTVKVHLAAIYRSLGAHNRTEAVARIVGGDIMLRPQSAALRTEADQGLGLCAVVGAGG